MSANCSPFESETERVTEAFPEELVSFVTTERVTVWSSTKVDGLKDTLSIVTVAALANALKSKRNSSLLMAQPP